MIGLQTYNELKKVEHEANQLGFAFSTSKHHRDYDGIALYAMNDEMPLYARDAELWFADLAGVRNFLAGVNFARNYYQMLGLFTDAKQRRKEQDVRNRQLANRIKNEPTGEIKK